MMPAGRDDLAVELEAAGAEVVVVPLPTTPSARVVLAALPLSGCVLRTPAEVDWLDDERDAPSWQERPMAFCLGRETARRADSRGWQSVIELPEVLDGAALAAEIERALA